ncbi:beta strand repeat-containing protein [Amphibiibacter pelophylacis]|uniref:YDG domain-containing protein n=1 Tax=Amphibiibacter pelophylacis TaxID=1799477 RepID=A0ACC6NYX4_9BURK
MLNGDIASEPAIISGGTKSTSEFYTAGSHDLTAFGGGTGLAGLGYALAYTPGTLTVAQKALAVSGITAESKTYDGNTAATVSTAAAQCVGLVAGDVVTVSATGAFDGENVGANRGVALTSVYGGAELGNYLISGQGGTAASILPKALTASLTGTTRKIYDGSTAASLGASNFSLIGFVGSEGASISQTAGLYADANAGSAKTVSATLSAGDFSASGTTLLSNYALPTSAEGSIGSIAPKALTASLTGATHKTYDGSTAASLGASNFSLIGFVSSEGASVSQTAGRYLDANAGSGKAVSATLSAGDFSASGTTLLSNYALPTSAEGSIGSILPKALTASLTGTTRKTYDGSTAASLNASNFSLSGFVDSEGASVSQTAGRYADANAGSAKTVSATLAAGDFSASGTTLLSNYALPTSAEGPIGSITPKALTASLTGATRKIYDGSTAASLGASNFSLSGFVDSEGASVSQTAGRYDDANAGSGKTVSATLAAGDFSASGATLLSNYALPTRAEGSIGSIARKAIAITGVAAADKTYDGSTTATLTRAGSVSTGVGDETLVVTADAASAHFSSKDVAAGKTVTVTGLALQDGSGGGLASNYALLDSAVTTTASITPKALTVSGISAADKVYDRTTDVTVDASRAVIEGLVGGDQVQVAAAGRFSDKNVGADKKVRLESSYSGGDRGNYTIADQASTTASITPRAARVGGITASDKAYDGTVAASVSTSQAAVSGLLDGDQVRVTVSGNFADRNAGTHAVDLSVSHQGSDAANYSYSDQASATATITPRVITLTAPSVSRVYDGGTGYTASAAELAALATHLVKGDGLAQVSLAFDSKNVGIGKTLTLSKAVIDDGNGGKNYNVTLKENTTSRITRLDSVTWVGAPNAEKPGSWFDPANWAGGAVPDLANVAHVVIPAGVTVRFDPAGAKGSAVADQPVQVDGIGSGLGSLMMAGGDLQVGADGLKLDALTQSVGRSAVAGAGAASVSGDMPVSQELIQTGGAVALERAFVSGTQTQSGAAMAVSGTLRGGDLSISGGTLSVDGGTSVNQLHQSGGTLDFYGPVNLADTFSQTGGSATTHGSLKGGSVAVSQSGRFNARSTVDLETLSVDGGRVSLDRGLNARQLDLRGGTLLTAGPVNAGTLNRSGGNFVQDGQETGLVDPGQVTASVAAPTEGSPVLRNPDTPAPTLTVVGDVTLPPSVRAVMRVASTPASPGQPATLNVEIRPDALSRPEGFTFAVPQRVWGGESSQGVRAQLPDGKPLPSGVSFDARTQRFTVASKADVTLPLTVVLRAASGQEVVVVVDAG